MTDPLPDPAPDYPPPTPFLYSDDDIQHLCARWRLTDQQQRALPLLLQWMIPKQIAPAMALSTHSVRNMIQAICIRADIHGGANGIRQQAADDVARHHTSQARERARAIEWERCRNERKKP